MLRQVLSGLRIMGKMNRFYWVIYMSFTYEILLRYLRVLLFETRVPFGTFILFEQLLYTWSLKQHQNFILFEQLLYTWISLKHHQLRDEGVNSLRFVLLHKLDVSVASCQYSFHNVDHRTMFNYLKFFWCFDGIIFPKDTLPFQSSIFIA